LLKKRKKEKEEEEAFLSSDQFMLSVKVKEIKGVVLQMESRVVVESIVVFLLRKS